MCTKKKYVRAVGRKGLMHTRVHAHASDSSPFARAFATDGDHCPYGR